MKKGLCICFSCGEYYRETLSTALDAEHFCSKKCEQNDEIIEDTEYVREALKRRN